MQIPSELTKVQTDLAASTRKIETTLKTDESTIVAFVKAHKAQIVGAFVFVASIVAVVVIAHK